MKNLRVGVIMGGRSAERMVSLRSGAAVCAALRERGYDAQTFDLEDPNELLNALKREGVDIAFLALHGAGGEDGCVQGLLELSAIAYTGSGVLASALAMDKLKAKELFRLHNVPTPGYYLATDGEEQFLSVQHAAFGFPAVVKPRAEGSSVGLKLVRSKAELVQAVKECIAISGGGALVERFVMGREFAVGVLDGKALGLLEVECDSDLFDYQAKYESLTTRYNPVPELSKAQRLGMYNIAVRAAQALDCRGVVRVDLVLADGGNEAVLEVNTLPGMAAESLLPRIAAHAGLELGALCEEMLRSALSHHASLPKVHQLMPQSGLRPIRVAPSAVRAG